MSTNGTTGQGAADTEIAIIIGSLRRSARSRDIARHVISYLPQGWRGSVVEIGDLPLYDADYDDPAVPDKPLPSQYARFRQAVRAASGVLFITPENNRTIPACVKNAVDIGSKPGGEAVWTVLPAGVISHSVGSLGGYSANKNLRLALSYFDMPMPGQSEVFLPRTGELLDERGEFRSARTEEFLRDYVERFARLVVRRGR